MTSQLAYSRGFNPSLSRLSSFHDFKTFRSEWISLSGPFKVQTYHRNQGLLGLLRSLVMVVSGHTRARYGLLYILIMSSKK